MTNTSQKCDNHTRRNQISSNSFEELFSPLNCQLHKENKKTGKHRYQAEDETNFQMLHSQDLKI